MKHELLFELLFLLVVFVIDVCVCVCVCVCACVRFNLFKLYNRKWRVCYFMLFLSSYDKFITIAVG